MFTFQQGVAPLVFTLDDFETQTLRVEGESLIQIGYWNHCGDAMYVHSFVSQLMVENCLVVLCYRTLVFMVFEIPLDSTLPIVRDIFENCG